MILVSFSLLNMTTGAVAYFHGYYLAGYILALGFITTVFGMTLWFKDVITESTSYKIFNKFLFLINKHILWNKFIYFNLLNISFFIINNNNNLKLLDVSESENELLISKFYNNKELGFYLSGLLEGDGNIYIPAYGKTNLNRILNPRFVFTFHKNNIELYKLIQVQLKGKGYFQNKDKNTKRYIIADIEGIKLLISILHNKRRTPKKITFNKLIHFMNTKYNLNFEESLLDNSEINDNSWLTGFIDADGHFGIKIRDAIAKSLIRKRSRSFSISLVFKLDQRSFDRPTASSMFSIMEKISKFLSCNLITIKRKLKFPCKLKTVDLFSVEISALKKIEILINYFNKYPLLGIKQLDF
jgi:LAGLIDADG endonuclease/Cytochrome c oxidase subunit III